ncbi:hypothetical protein SAMN05421747_11698 [Parapedobacter composti]|uniref:Uncharacterized protein n=2 Tax=Parapedobacter composti TaxID=623281 RepID=A0A1I1KPF6_9SPHI|nr:hypothetical protein SAMN05421747_11698 [Parapedobacter composti]
MAGIDYKAQGSSNLEGIQLDITNYKALKYFSNHIMSYPNTKVRIYISHRDTLVVADSIKLWRDRNKVLFDNSISIHEHSLQVSDVEKQEHKEESGFYVGFREERHDKGIDSVLLYTVEAKNDIFHMKLGLTNNKAQQYFEERVKRQYGAPIVLYYTQSPGHIYRIDSIKIIIDVRKDLFNE